MDGADAKSVLRGDGGYGAGTMHATACKGLQIGLNTGAAAGV